VKGSDPLEALCEERDNTDREGTGWEGVGLFKNVDRWRFVENTVVNFGVPGESGNVFSG
jgi:hypothetical protein